MFEHLDADARRVTDVAIASAHELGHGWLGTEHLLIGALAMGAAPCGRAAHPAGGGGGAAGADRGHPGDEGDGLR